MYHKNRQQNTLTTHRVSFRGMYKTIQYPESVLLYRTGVCGTLFGLMFLLFGGSECVQNQDVEPAFQHGGDHGG